MGASSPQPSAVLAQLREKHRPILVFGPNLDDERMTRQRHAWVGPLPEAGIKDRELIVIEIPEQGEGRSEGRELGPAEGRELRAQFGIAAGAFAVVLIGRDGAEKVRWADVVSAQEIFGKVDAMPMRIREVQERGGAE